MDKIGKKALLQTPLFLLSITLVLFSIIGTIYWSHTKLQSINEQKFSILSLESLALSSRAFRQKKTTFINNHHLPSGGSIEIMKNIDLLNNEKQLLDEVSLQPYLNNGDELRNRTQFICKTRKNNLISITASDKTPALQEYLHEQRDFIEVDENDLKQILLHFEDDSPTSPKPQTIIQDFILEKSSKNHSFKMKVNYLERAFLKKETKS